MSADKSKHPKNNPHPTPHDKSSADKSTKRHIFVEPRVQIDFVQDLREQYKASQEDNTGHSKKILFWTRISAGLLLVYVSLTAVQSWLTKNAIKDANEHFTKDQRPYVWRLRAFSEFPKPDKLTQFYFHIFYADFGKSPAINMRGRGNIFWGVNALSFGYQWLDNLGTKPFTIDNKTRQLILPPWVPTNPAEGDYETLHSDNAPTTAEQLTEVLSHDEQIVIVDRTQYYDTAGNFYWTDFCLAHLASGSMEYCAKHNEIH